MQTIWRSAHKQRAHRLDSSEAGKTSIMAARIDIVSFYSRIQNSVKGFL